MVLKTVDLTKLSLASSLGLSQGLQEGEEFELLKCKKGTNRFSAWHTSKSLENGIVAVVIHTCASVGWESAAHARAALHIGTVGAGGGRVFMVANGSATDDSGTESLTPLLLPLVQHWAGDEKGLTHALNPVDRLRGKRQRECVTMTMKIRRQLQQEVLDLADQGLRGVHNVDNFNTVLQGEEGDCPALTRLRACYAFHDID